ncbi:class I SAM-dependent methyltransferase [Aneurinibacillus sp. Ricciae_BoGa-3]|uniref:class I SAM-dependent methyltransferase n=1 Tax=Aneurinibacillus sp. Ricciae_BoGa-3 TaxID=3022697 RepID=UPI002341E2B5|nr:class I SAM-dependent methyltransferase [Aneurinibacillus sp. Ricciae_BoGa-3]WCK55687.1 class I SAM-dependent methyltransferase [Aneurinibacillus sp. Ricciae_BoGa-3]
MGFDWHQACQEQWNKMSDNWQANSREMWEEGSRKNIIPVLTRYIQPAKGPVLDAGCGDGYGSMLLAQKGFEVTGIDLAGQMIEKASARISPDMRLSFQQGDVTSLPFDKEYFQSIMAINVLEWTSYPHNVLLELKRHLKPDGILAIGVLGPTAAPRQHSYKRLHGKEVIMNTIMPWECARLLGDTGFEVVHQDGVYKRGVTDDMTSRLSLELCQALSFLWMFYARPAIG